MLFQASRVRAQSGGGGDGGRTQAGHHHCGYFTDLQVAAFHSLVG